MWRSSRDWFALASQCFFCDLNEIRRTRLEMTYVKYNPNLERPRPDEDKFVDKIVEALHRNNEWAFKKYKHGIRDAHAKSHACLRGELEIYRDLPAELRQGLFATPKKYPVIARLSSTHPAIRSDQIRGVRAIAIKVIGVQGRRAVENDDANTQDFVLVNHPDFPYADARDYYKKGMPAAWVLARLPDGLLWVVTEVMAAARWLLSIFDVPFPPALALFTGPNNNILGETYHSAAPLRYGEYVAKINLVPFSKSVRQLRGRRIPRNAGPEALRLIVADFFGKNSAEYEVQVQLCTDTAAMPIEDATVHWPESESPPRGVARITFGVQKADSFNRRVYADDVLSFNSWRALAAHRPLGSINRLKRKVYDASSDFRHKVNNAPQIEPRRIWELPRE